MTIKSLASEINQIVFGSRDSDNVLGMMRQIAHDLWHESGAQSDKALFEFREIERTATSIVLHDTRRDMRIAADLSRNLLRLTQRGQPPRDAFGIRSTAKEASGWLVNRIEFTNAHVTNGSVRQIGDGKWQELDPTGKVVFRFNERARDEWSVYLVDPTRGVDIQCDLARKKVLLRNATGAELGAYDILSSSNRVNALTVRQVAHGSPRGAVNGRFCETSERKWVEEGEVGKAIYHYAELRRDDWSVYLEDSVRGIRIELDLRNNKIRFASGSAPFTDLYDIVDASAAHTGWSLKAIDVGSLDSTLTHYRQSGTAAWEEAAPGQPAQFSFFEVARDARRVRLHDPSRHIGLEIDLKRRKVRYAERSKPFRDLYDVSNCSSVIDGRTALKVDFVTPDALRTGSFVKSGDTQWSELRSDGSVVYSFDEVGRDDWSVYLKDSSRDVKIQLDLWRRQVGYASGRNELTDRYNITDYTSKMTGWLVNHVAYQGASQSKVGVFRQTGINQWVEDAGPDRIEAFTFRETGRDDWSVYLVDDSRKVEVQLDLWRSTVLYADPQTTLRPWYTISSAERLPHLGLKSAGKVNWVVVGESGISHSSLRQIGPVRWAEFDANGQRTSSSGYIESQRDHWNVYLVDENTGAQSIRIDLFGDRVFSRDSAAVDEKLVAHVLEARTRLNFWLANSVLCADNQVVQTHFRQTGYVAWVEQHRGDNTTYLYDEIGRDDLSITLHDPERNVRAVLDLNSRRVTYSGLANARDLAIAVYERKSELWLTARRMTSRSDLTESVEIVNGSRQSKPVYRSSLSLPQLTTHIDLTASEQVAVEVDGRFYMLDAQNPVRIRASLTLKMSVSIPANQLQCPAVYVRTNLMEPGERHVLMADVGTHNRLATLADGELYNARDQLGLATQLKKEDVDHIQTALSNIARTAQHSYNRTPHGVHHDRALLPSNMRHTHFKLDFSGGGARYQPLTAAEVAAQVAGAERLSPTAAQGFLDDIGNFFKKTASIVVHTVEKVGEVIVDAARHVVNDVVETVDQVGEDLIHGDILEAGKDLIQGGEHLGSDLVKGAFGVGGAVVKGASQLLVVTVEFGGKLKQFVIDHTGFIGKAIGWLLDKAGVALGNAVRWLLSPLGWDDILHVHDYFRDAVNNQLDWLKGFTKGIKAESDSFFANLASGISSDVEELVHQVNADQFKTTAPSTAAHSGAIEKVEWLMTKLFQYSHDTSPLAAAFVPGSSSGPLAPIEKMLSDELGSGGSKVREAFEDSLDQLVAVFTDNNSAPEHLLAAVLDIAKGIALLGLDVAAKVIDLVLDLVSAAVDGFKDLLNMPMNIPIMSDFYKGLTDGRPMTILSIASLLLATPVTIIHKALTKELPFASGPATELADQSAHVKSIGNTYGSMHILMSILGPINAGMTAASMLAANVDALAGTPKATTSSFSPGTTVIRGINLALGFVAQIMACPIPPDEPYTMPGAAAKNDVIEAPNYWSHVIWHCQWGFFLIQGLASVGLSVAEAGRVKLSALGKSGDLIAGFSAAWGFAHMTLMGVLDVADRRKRKALALALTDSANLDTEALMAKIEIAAHAVNATNVPFSRPTLPEQRTAFVATLLNYYAWSQDLRAGYPLVNKGFGNVMDGLPEFGQLFSMPSVIESTEGLSLIGMTLAELFGHITEGAVYIKRTANNELL